MKRMINFLVMATVFFLPLAGCFVDEASKEGDALTGYELSFEYQTGPTSWAQKKLYSTAPMLDMKSYGWVGFWASLDSKIELLEVDLPADVMGGSQYKYGSKDFFLEYTDPSGNDWKIQSYDTLKIRVTTWEGPGGMCEGTFEGTLANLPLRNGKFSILIGQTEK